jgi:GH25 family lysozyme M1 (1,4-beta-N-acetylmuramidase)
MRLGIDISHWNEDVDIAKLKEDGVEFVLIKLSDWGPGGGFTDTHAQINVDKCKAAGMPYGFYHYYHPKYDAAAQASYFYAAWKAIHGEEGTEGVWFDVETNDGLTPSALIPRLRSFCERCDALFGNFVGGIYTRKTWWDPNVGQVAWAVKYGLWVAHYGVVSPWIPLPWVQKGWEIHQDTDKATFIGVYGFFDRDRRKDPVVKPPTLEETVEMVRRLMREAVKHGWDITTPSSG